MALDLQKISKAIAGGMAASAAGSGSAYLMIPPGLELPVWVYALLPAVNFALGFAVVYFAPANTISPNDPRL